MYNAVGTSHRVAVTVSSVILLLSTTLSTAHPQLSYAKSPATDADSTARVLRQRDQSSQQRNQATSALVAGTGAISGTLTAAANGAPARAIVEVYSSRTSNSPVNTTASDSNGHYVFEGLNPGTYFVGFSNYNESNFLPGFYDNQPSQAQATPVTVTVGVTTPVDAALAAGGVITGRVTQDGDGDGIYFVSVRVYTSTLPNAQPVARDITDQDGYYILRGMRGGTYYLYFDTFFVSEYLKEYYDNASTLAQSSPITVTEGNTITVNAGLARGAVITGAFTSDDTGEPVKGGVYVYDSPTKTNYIAYASTYPANGYIVTGLPSGVYYVKAQPDYQSNYFPEFYADQAEQATATPITVSLNTTTTVNFALASGALVTGRVVEDGTGTPISDTLVSVYNNDQDEYRTATTNADGYYVVNGLKGGGYIVRFGSENNYLPEYYDNKASGQDSNPITVAAKSTLPNINASLAVGGRILGRVTAADSGLGLSNVYLNLYQLQNDEYRSISSDFGTDADGYYTVTRLLTGTYRVQFVTGSGNSQPYLSEFYDGAGLLETATNISVVVGADVAHVNATLERGGQIAGRVTAADTDSGLHLVYVNVYSNTQLMTRASTDPNGDYTTDGVPAGNYTIQFAPHSSWQVTEEYVGEWYSDTLTQTTAIPVNVAVGTTTQNINASLLHGVNMTGTVQYANGTFAYAYLLDATTGEELKYVFVSGGSRNTFEFKGVGPGTYKIKFYGGALDSTALLRPSTDYIYMYYNQKTALNAADVITVTGSANVSGVDGQILNDPSNPRPLKVNLPLVVR